MCSGDAGMGGLDSYLAGKIPRVSLALPSLTYPGCRPCYLVTELWTPTDLVFFLAAAYSG